MENVHGVDVSWIHHSHKDKIHRPVVPASVAARPALDKTPLPSQTKPATSDNAPPPPAPPTQSAAKPPTTPEKQTFQTEAVSEPLPSPPAQPTHQSRRNSLLRRNSREKVNGQNGSADATKASPKRSAASSWISSLSSKLSSSQSPSHQPPPTSNSQQIHQQQQAHLTSQSTPALSSSTASLSGSPATANGGSAAADPYVPQQPRSAGASFLSNALRRLSSSSQLGSGGKVMTGGVCPRMVLNIDPNRQRCYLPELEPTKLRRVAFCVDVEIAGGPHYNDDLDPAEKKKLEKDRKLKEKAEGAALKNPEVMAEDKEKVDPDGTKPEAPTTAEQAGNATVEPEKKELSRKKEKKKRSEEERKERKEQKRRKAEDSGSIPMQIVRSTENVVDTQSLPSTPRPMDRPTVDPLRIYRRCCQLRETPILRRITEQLALPSNCPIASPGVVMSLDLTGSRLQPADVVTLSDWLAIVPVKKLILEDSDFNDEAIRVILAGLLAAMIPDFSRKHPLPGDKYDERAGVVEKLSLKNNPKITKEGWKHISLFIYLCKSIKSLDVSMNFFPPSPSESEIEAGKPDPAEVFGKAISGRIGGNHLEELIMGECSLTSHHIRKIVDAVTISGIKRLGLAGNSIDLAGLQHIIHYLRSGVCQGIDLGGNNLRDHLEVLGEAFESDCPIWALSLADCNLDATSLKPLFPGLLNLQNLRFLDLSLNPELFTAKISALGLIRKYLPMMIELRRIHLNNVDIAPSQAIALADVLGECPHLAHISILNNPQLTALAAATEEEAQEEACALYASLMAAARVSTSLISIEIDIPTAENSEVVKALAKQVVAYCLRNMERSYPVALSPNDQQGDATNGTHEVKHVPVPGVLLHIVGDSEGQHDDSQAPDNDYIVGGQGVVKALRYCLSDLKTGSMQSGVATPLEAPEIGAKARTVSKNLLESARKIRVQLQPALVKEAKGTDDMAFRRLLFLDNTLKGIIQRFEDEYPETRVDPPESPAVVTKVDTNDSSSTHSATDSATLQAASQLSDVASSAATYYNSDSEDEDSRPRLGPRSRHASDVSLAAKALAKEEGAVHKIGQEVKRQLKQRKGDEVFEKSFDDEGLRQELEQEHIRMLKEKLSALKEVDGTKNET